LKARSVKQRKSRANKNWNFTKLYLVPGCLGLRLPTAQFGGMA
jgi:hypothetical protein